MKQSPLGVSKFKIRYKIFLPKFLLGASILALVNAGATKKMALPVFEDPVATFNNLIF